MCSIYTAFFKSAPLLCRQANGYHYKERYIVLLISSNATVMLDSDHCAFNMHHIF